MLVLGRDRRFEVFEIDTRQPLAVYEEARRGINAVLLVRLLTHSDDLVEKLLVGQALLEGLPRKNCS